MSKVFFADSFMPVQRRNLGKVKNYRLCLWRPVVLRLVNIGVFEVRPVLSPVLRRTGRPVEGSPKFLISGSPTCRPLPKLKLGGWSSFCGGGLFQSLITSGAA